jgi:hypothetical protein
MFIFLCVMKSIEKLIYVIKSFKIKEPFKNLRIKKIWIEFSLTIYH